MKLPTIRKLNILSFLKLFENKNVEIILDNGLSYRGKLIKAFRLGSPKNVYIHIKGEDNMRYFIKTDNMNIISVEDKLDDKRTWYVVSILYLDIVGHDYRVCVQDSLSDRKKNRKK